MRPLLALLILLVSMTTSGITSAIAATITDSDACCADAEREATDHGEDEQLPDGERDECPPLCHACACSPMFAVPDLAGPHVITRELQRIDPIDGYSQLPTSPPGTDVFHPPRRTA